MKNNFSRIIPVIPAYNPPDSLPDLVGGLIGAGFGRVVVVDDGSSDSGSAEIFRRFESDAKLVLLRHAVNRGKGAALKTAFRHIIDHCPDIIGVVTLDADGQHEIEDAARVASMLASGDAMILGSRVFSSSKMPWRALVGNIVTKHVFRLFVGERLSDTQTGLRGIPAAALEPFLKLAANGYDFELEMILSCRQLGFGIGEVAIKTVYLEGNCGSHFKPLRDSLKIYLKLFKFACLGRVKMR